MILIVCNVCNESTYGQFVAHIPPCLDLFVSFCFDRDLWTPTQRDFRLSNEFTLTSLCYCCNI